MTTAVGRAKALLVLLALLAPPLPLAAAEAPAQPATGAPAPGGEREDPFAVDRLVLPVAPAERPRILDVRIEGGEGAALRRLLPLQDGAPLDRREVRDAVRVLYSSGRFARVGVWVEPVPREQAPQGWPGAVRLVFVVEPVRKLVAVAFAGHQQLAESILLQTVGLQVNAEYQPDLVARGALALKDAYTRLGYRAVVVTPETHDVPGGVQLLLRVEEGKATRIGRLRFTGEPGLEQDELQGALNLGEGDVLNLALLDEGLRGLRERYRLAGRLRARVEAPRFEELGPALLALTIPVEAGPQVSFHVRGARAFPESLLLTKLKVEPDETLDDQLCGDLAGRLRRFYVQNGFLDARVLWRRLPETAGGLQVVFLVEEGPRVRVEEIQFTQNKAFSDDQLRLRVLLQLRDNIQPDPAFGADPAEVAQRGLMGRLEHQPPERTRVDPDTVFDPLLYTRAFKQIEDLYRSQGYLQVSVGPPQLERLSALPVRAPHQRPVLPERLVEQRARVIVPVKEGDQSLVKRIVIEGGTEVPREEVDAAVVLRVGSPFSYLAAEEGRAALAQLYTRRGHFHAHVEDEEVPVPPEPGDPKGIARLEVRYRIQAGPVVRVAGIEVVGHRYTQEWLIRSLIGLKPGDPLTPDGIDRGQHELLLTGLFFSATITPRNPEVVEEQKAVLVQVRERPRRELQGSVGYSIDDGPRTSLQYTQGNLFGRNLTFTALGRVNFPYLRYNTTVCTPDCHTEFILPSDPVERLIDLGISIPRLEPLTSALRASLDLIHERDYRLSYQLLKFSSQISVALNRPRPFGAQLTYEAGYQFLSLNNNRSLADLLARTDQQIFNQEQGSVVFGSLRPTLTLDLRDDLARPRSGFYLQFAGDYFKSLATLSAGDPVIDLIKLQGLAAVYLPLPAQSSLLLSARGGRIFPLSSQVVPGDRAFYLGGPANLRGFNQDALQPQDTRDRSLRAVRDCLATLSGLACTINAQLIAAGGISAGGNAMMALGAELRLAVSQAVELALFYDAGNLYQDPNKFSLVLRDAAGAGLRYVTPIGRMAVDLGFNLQPEVLLGEPPWRFYFSIDVL